jgi:hypothetical protein
MTPEKHKPPLPFPLHFACTHYLTRMKTSLAIILLGALLATAADDTVDYNFDVRPILSKNCFACHGPDAHDRKADLRLDTYAGAIELRKGNRAIDPDDLANSDFIARIRTTDPDDIMPPPDSHRRLTAAQMDILERWIKQGAPYETHWAFNPPTQPEPPALPKGAIAHNPIDHFIAAKLGDLPQSQEASKHSLIRRVTFDLTGLPPTPEEVDAFLADSADKAYEKVVDRLLRSPHFGERMALGWMDAARYGDTSVMHADGPRTMWPWRDWVIKAYNDNKPFNDFTIEQLAGDLLPNATDDNRLATGFNRNHASSDEGGAFAEELRVDYVVDRVQTTANVWLGLSMECGQCHEHKYDPISQREYYQFFAYFNNTADPGMQTRKGNQSPVVNVPDPDREAELAEIARAREALEAKIAARRKAVETDLMLWVAEQQTQLEEGVQAPMPGGLVHHFPIDSDKAPIREGISGTEGKFDGKRQHSKRGDNTCLKLNNNRIDFANVANELEFDQPFTLAAWVKPPKNASGAIFARMDNDNDFRGFDFWMQGGNIGTHIIHKWPENAIKVITKEPLKPNTWVHVAITYDGKGKESGVNIYVDGVLKPHNVEQDGLTATIKNDLPFRIGGRHNASYVSNVEVDDIRIYKRALVIEEVARIQDGGNTLHELLSVPVAERSPEQQNALANIYLTAHDEPYKALLKEKSAIDSRASKINTASKLTSMIMQDNSKRRVTYILNRGMYDSPIKDEEIPPGVPAFLPGLPEDAPDNRLGLAQWLMDDEHPLTARVAVNRYWAMLFGTGIVKTVIDFGNQGDLPSHPELLDWLAVDLIKSGWDIKHTLKQMVMSATYRQSAAISPVRLAADPDNRLLASGPRYRLQGEFIRDNALAVSGLLVPIIGGPGVKPYQPDGLWNEVSLNGGLRFKPDSGEKLYRRSMYTYWKRSAPAPSMTIFDAPSREKCVVQRARTNTPLQALVTLNDVQFVEASRNLAERVMKQDAEFAKRINAIFKLCVSRAASAAEIAICREVFDQQLAVFQQDLEAAKKHLALGESKRDESLDAAEHAAWTVLSTMILNMDEVLTRG